MNGKLVGKVLWWSERDGNGIITDDSGNEYYVDRSVVGPKQEQKLSRGLTVMFISDRCNELLVAKAINIPAKRTIDKHEEKVKIRQAQLVLPF